MQEQKKGLPGKRITGEQKAETIKMAQKGGKGNKGRKLKAPIGTMKKINGKHKKND